MTPTNGKKPRTQSKLSVQWANGEESRHAYFAHQLRWNLTGHPFDIVAARKA